VKVHRWGLFPGKTGKLEGTERLDPVKNKMSEKSVQKLQIPLKVVGLRK
jgi:hypothetical protein